MSYSGQILSVLDTVGLNTTENQKLLNEHAPHSFKLLQALGVLRASDILSEENVVLLLNNPANSWHLAGILVALNQHGFSFSSIIIKVFNDGIDLTSICPEHARDLRLALDTLHRVPRCFTLDNLILLFKNVRYSQGLSKALVVLHENRSAGQTYLTDENIVFLSQYAEHAEMLSEALRDLSRLEQNRTWLIQHAESIQDTQTLENLTGKPIFTPAIASLLCKYAPYAQSLGAAIQALHLEKRLTINVLEILTQDIAHIHPLCNALATLQQESILTTQIQDLILDDKNRLIVDDLVNLFIEMKAVDLLSAQILALLTQHPEHALGLGHALLTLKQASILTQRNCAVLAQYPTHAAPLSNAMRLLNEAGLLNPTTIAALIQHRESLPTVIAVLQRLQQANLLTDKNFAALMRRPRSASNLSHVFVILGEHLTDEDRTCLTSQTMDFNRLEKLSDTMNLLQKNNVCTQDIARKLVDLIKKTNSSQSFLQTPPTFFMDGHDFFSVARTLKILDRTGCLTEQRVNLIFSSESNLKKLNPILETLEKTALFTPENIDFFFKSSDFTASVLYELSLILNVLTPLALISQNFFSQLIQHREKISKFWEALTILNLERIDPDQAFITQFFEPNFEVFLNALKAFKSKNMLDSQIVDLLIQYAAIFADPNIYSAIQKLPANCMTPQIVEEWKHLCGKNHGNPDLATRGIIETINKATTAYYERKRALVLTSQQTINTNAKDTFDLALRSINNLYIMYYDDINSNEKITGILKEIETYLNGMANKTEISSLSTWDKEETFKITAAIQRFDHLSTNDIFIESTDIPVTSQELLSLVWLALKNTADPSMIGIKLISALNSTHQISAYSLGEPYAPVCNRGTLIELIKPLQGVHPQVRLALITPELAFIVLKNLVSEKIIAYLKEEARTLNNPEAQGLFKEIIDGYDNEGFSGMHEVKEQVMREIPTDILERYENPVELNNLVESVFEYLELSEDDVKDILSALPARVENRR